MRARSAMGYQEFTPPGTVPAELKQVSSGPSPLPFRDSRRMQRKLAAILAADVVGYSRLVAEDDVGTLGALKARRRDLLEPLVTKCRGRVFKLMGDGVFIEFTSAVNAVECAVDLQKGMAESNAAAPDHPLQLRGA